MANIIESMAPVGRYADGSPIYAFHTSFPTGGLRTLEELGGTDPDRVEQAGREWVAGYESRDPYGNMGECLGVLRRDDGRYVPVVNTFHSNT